MHYIKNGHDATFTQDNRTKNGFVQLKNEHIGEMSLEYDVFISVSYYGSSKHLVQEVAKRWKEKEHEGYIIAIGVQVQTHR